MEVRGDKRFWSTQEKRQIVEETLKAGTSVSMVARAHDVNANQVFYWRKLYHEGRLVGESESRLLPVKITDSAVENMRLPSLQKSKLKRNGVIEIDLGHARVRIEGSADPDCVQATLAGLIR
jgi:transposase